MPPQVIFNSVITDIAHIPAVSCLDSKVFPGACPTPFYYKPRKSVSFNEVVKAKKTIHIFNFSDEEVAGYWYSHEDFEDMKRETRFEAGLLENGCLEEDYGNHTSRGLHMFAPEGSKQRNNSKRLCRELVLEEQGLQRFEGSNDPDYIAEIYASAAKTARSQAIAAAI